MKTSIQIYSETRDKLKKFGKKGDSYNDILLELIRLYEEKNKKK